MSTARHLVRAVPIAGWLLLLFAGAGHLSGRPVTHPALRAVLVVDAFLSVVVHAAQIPAALRRGGDERSPLATAALTMLFGMTWWATRPAEEGES